MHIIPLVPTPPTMHHHAFGLSQFPEPGSSQRQALQVAAAGGNQEGASPN